jgi:hypothetical protein
MKTGLFGSIHVNKFNFGPLASFFGYRGERSDLMKTGLFGSIHVKKFNFGPLASFFGYRGERSDLTLRRNLGLHECFEYMSLFLVR